ncbi:hypothetical protein BD560DRAFT_461653 [Blakeslea trispora]|nr:hypothetical protein BD560DRAFT_461653 [Blakeslea trispora]
MSLKRSKTTHSSVENRIEGVKHMLEVILTKVSTIESKCEGIDRRMDELEATATVSATVAAAAAQVTSSTPVPENNLIPLPRGNVGKAEALKLLQTSLEDEDEASVLEMLNYLDRKALLVCQSFANVDNNSNRTWREVLAEDKNSMQQQILTYAVASYPQLGFLEGCVDLWTITALIQPKWSSISTHARRKRKIQDLEEENQKLREQ